MGVKGMHSSPAQLANLRTFDKMDPVARKEMQRRAGRKGAEVANARRAKAKTFKEAAEWVMKLPAFDTDNDTVNALKVAYPDLTNAEAMTIALTAKTISEGDHRAFTTIRDTSGELPEQTVNVKNHEPMTINIKTVE